MIGAHSCEKSSLESNCTKQDTTQQKLNYKDLVADKDSLTFNEPTKVRAHVSGYKLKFEWYVEPPEGTIFASDSVATFTVACLCGYGQVYEVFCEVTDGYGQSDIKSAKIYVGPE